MIEEGGEEGPELMRARARLYLMRHGDGGRIDPELRLRRVSEEYRRWREDEKRSGKSTRAVGGSHWISLGPTTGAGRMTAIAPHPTAAGTVLAGAAGGGVWKTTDGGSTWQPLTEGINDLSVGAVAIPPSAPNTIYLGTGEGGYAIDFIPGIGFLKSTDGGANWILPASVIATTFYRLSVHPTNANELVAGTNGGAFRSTDGGASWTNVIARGTYGDVPDIVRDSGDPRILYATTWCRSKACSTTAARVLRSTDGGVSWTEKSAGLPAGTATGSDERMAIAISPSTPSVLYASKAILSGDTLVSHIFKSTNGGDSWTDLLALSGNGRRYLADQSWYNNTLAVSPSNSNVLIAGGTTYVRTTDGGTSFSTAFTSSAVHVDAHDLRYQGSTLWIANDGGVWTSTDDGVTAASRVDGLVTRQYYGLAIDSSQRNRVLAGAQDNGTQQRTDAREWRNVLGSDGFECAINPNSSQVAWGTIQEGAVLRTRQAGLPARPPFENVTPPYEDGEMTPFLSIVRADPRAANTIYTGSYRVWRSRDGGDTWIPLSTATTSGAVWSPQTTVTGIALSRTDPLFLLVAKERQVYRSTDGGNTWKAGTGLPNAIVINVEIDPTDSTLTYACIVTTQGPSVYRSTDGGTTWSAAANGLPLFAAQALRIDPTDPSILFVATDVGVFRSTDRGGSWTRFGSGLPSTSIHDMQILEDGSVLRIATHGRGVWELQVPPTGNTPPAVTIVAPAAAISAPKGATLAFSGAVSDPDAGDTAAGTWFFPDTSQTVALSGGSASVSHTFHQAGIFPVVLNARDSHGAVSGATAVVTITETSGDSCAAPFVIPTNGPFPYTIAVTTESTTSEATDPAPSCVMPGTGTFGSVWFEFDPPTAGAWEISTCRTFSDSVLTVYTGPACGPYTQIGGGCNDDSQDTTCGAQSSVLTVSGTPGQKLRIQVTAFDATSVGRVPLTIAPAGFVSPRVTGVSSSVGPSPGGRSVIVTGFGFVSGSTVSFGGVPATDVVFVGPTILTATTPPHSAGTVDVAVASPAGGTGTLVQGYSYESFVVTPCVPGTSTLCLNAGRFKTQVEWHVPATGAHGTASAVPLTADTGYFWFFSANNIELVVKVVDGRPVNGKFWVFYGALSNVEYTVTVTDTQTGIVKVYANPNGQLSSVADTSAF
ncbi:MAG: PKD domain-containing protein [Acidobacteriota bacterium]